MECALVSAPPFRRPTILKYIDIIFRSGIPIIVTLVSFWHFVVIRKQPLTPSIAFTSIIGEWLFSSDYLGWPAHHVPNLVFAEMRFALTSLPEIVINILQVSISIDLQYSMKLIVYQFAGHGLFATRRSLFKQRRSRSSSPSRTATQNNRIRIMYSNLGFSIIIGHFPSRKRFARLS